MSVVWVDVDVVDPLRIEVGGSSDQAMNLIAFLEEEFSQVRAVLPSDSGHKSNLPVGFAAVRAGSGSGFVGLGCHLGEDSKCVYAVLCCVCALDLETGVIYREDLVERLVLEVRIVKRWKCCTSFRGGF